MNGRLFTLNQEKEIYKLYFEKKLSLRQIAKIWKCSQKAIWLVFYRAGIKLRTIAEANKDKLREKNNNWKGGEIIRSGYISIHKPNHPFTNKQGYIKKHRLIIEKHLGRYLKPEEVVHHINGMRDDNRIENLMIFVGDKDHQSWHKIKKQETMLLQKDFANAGSGATPYNQKEV